VATKTLGSCDATSKTWLLNVLWWVSLHFLHLSSFSSVRLSLIPVTRLPTMRVSRRLVWTEPLPEGSNQHQLPAGGSFLCPHRRSAKVTCHHTSRIEVMPTTAKGWGQASTERPIFPSPKNSAD
jgi:hypothetical protein